MSAARIGSRRDFLKGTLSGAAVLCAGGSAARVPLAADSVAAGARSRVVVARDEMLRGSASGVDALLMQTLFDRDAPVDVWKKIVRSKERVSLKVNTLGGRGISTDVQLVEAVCERLQQAGIKPSDILVWDRDSAELERAGFHLAIGGERVQCSRS
jgi:hypothetical protein